jgi:hypothetical protein
LHIEIFGTGAVPQLELDLVAAVIHELSSELSLGGRLIVNFIEVIVEVPVEDLSLAHTRVSLDESLEGVLALAPEKGLLVVSTVHFGFSLCVYSLNLLLYC